MVVDSNMLMYLASLSSSFVIPLNSLHLIERINVIRERVYPMQIWYYITVEALCADMLIMHSFGSKSSQCISYL